MTARHKNIALIVGFLALLIVGYRISLSKTLDTKNRVQKLEREVSHLSKLNGQSSKVIAHNVYLDSVLSVNKIKNNSVQNTLLEILNTASQNSSFEITEFNQPHRYQDEQTTILSYSFSLRGSYKAIEQIIFELEQNHNLGEITHLSFEKKRDYRRGRDYLECFVVLEGVGLE